VSTMSAGDMFVPLGSEQARLINKSEIIRNSASKKMLGGAVLAASVMLATKLKAKETEQEGSSKSGETDGLQTASLSSATPDASGMNLDNVLGSVSAVDEAAKPVQVAALGNASRYSNNSSIDFVSETGLPDGFVTPSLGVSDPSQSTNEVPVEFSEASEKSQTTRVSGGGTQVVRGADGEDGEDGADGQDGQDGADGQDGQDGADGQDGQGGADGQDGQGGADGQDGQDGADGQDGQDGADGQDGQDGADGQDGQDGADGQDGQDGADGQDGQDGADGQDGQDGADGQDGQDGADGQDGRDGQTVLILDRSLVEDSGLLDVLDTVGADVIDGPLDTLIVRLDPEQLELLVEAINEEIPGVPGIGNPTPPPVDAPPEIATGTDQQDFIVGDDRDNHIEGLGEDDILIGGLGADILDGGNGNDIAGYRDSLESVFIDLENDIASGGTANGDQLISIENLDGSDLNDTLYGDEVANFLFGNDGDDIIFGRGGADTIAGGAGADLIDGGASLQDTADYSESDAGVIISLLDDTAAGGHAEGDELDFIEYLDGSFHDDFLQGDDLNNRLGGRNGEDVLFGEGGNDTLLGGTGADILDGGEGIDTADYTASTEAVTVDLLLDDASGGEATGDVLINIENLAGSRYDDTLIGDDGDNRLTGRDGDDTLIGNGGDDRFIGGRGADHMDGGEGDRDTVDYSAASEAIGVELDFGGFMGEADGDTFTDIEFVVGSAFDDTIIGNDAVNRLTGGAGNDDLAGLGGDDTIIGGQGNDFIEGGEGDDVFIFEGDSGHDLIVDFEAGEGRGDRIWLQDQGFADFDALQSAITDTDQGAVINLNDSSTVLLEGIAAADLVADDFILA